MVAFEGLQPGGHNAISLYIADTELFICRWVSAERPLLGLGSVVAEDLGARLGANVFKYSCLMWVGADLTRLGQLLNHLVRPPARHAVARDRGTIRPAWKSPTSKRCRERSRAGRPRRPPWSEAGARFREGGGSDDRHRPRAGPRDDRRWMRRRSSREGGRQVPTGRAGSPGLHRSDRGGRTDNDGCAGASSRCGWRGGRKRTRRFWECCSSRSASTLRRCSSPSWTVPARRVNGACSATERW